MLNNLKYASRLLLLHYLMQDEINNTTAKESDKGRKHGCRPPDHSSIKRCRRLLPPLEANDWLGEKQFKIAKDGGGA